MDDVIKLIGFTYSLDEYGNQIPTPEERQVFCEVRSVTRSEFYSAAQTDLHPDYIFRLSHYRDYRGEKFVKYKDWTGTEKVYSVLRTYRAPEGDAVEITATERVGNGQN